MKKQFCAACAIFAFVFGAQAESASAFTPTVSMIKRLCVQLSKGFEPRFHAIKPKLALRADQTALWQQFSEKILATTQPVVSLCNEKFGPNAPEPGWFANASERQKADQDRALFLKTMDGMTGGVDAAMTLLNAGLSPEQLKTAQGLMKLEM